MVNALRKNVPNKPQRKNPGKSHMQQYARRRPRKKCTKKLPSRSCTEKDPAKNSIETVHAKDCKGGTPWEKAQGKNRAKGRTQNGSVENCTGATLKNGLKIPLQKSERKYALQRNAPKNFRGMSPWMSPLRKTAR